ncbi:MAG: glycosyltransferase [Nitrospirae bacterium]|nr:glycosyltransferase [Nitrospirota bacterium]
MKSFYDRNLDVLNSKNGDLALRAENINTGNDIEVLTSREGLPALKIKGMALHSTYYPGKEGERILESCDIKNIDSVIVLGLGFGYHISPSLLRNFPHRIIIIEHRLDILKAAMEAVDLKPLLENGKLLVALDFEEIISDGDLINCMKGKPLIIENRPSVSLYGDYYGRIKNYIQQNKPRKLNVLMASISSPVSAPIYYEKALRKICSVITFGPLRDRAFWAGFAEGLKTHYYYREGTAEHWTDICARLSKPCDIVTGRGIIDIRDILRQLPPGFKPDIFLWIDQHRENIPANLEYLECPKVALFGDTHLGDITSRLQYALNYDYVFVMFNKQHIERFKESGCQRVFWSPAACDPDIHCKIPADKIYPVSFVGSTHPYLHLDRVRILDLLKKNNIDIHIDSKLLQDMSLIFSRSKIVFNKNIAEDLNQRVFEVLGTGSLLLTNRLSRDTGMEDLFKDRHHLVLYDNEQELVELIHYYLEHEDEREKIALAGYKEALSKHTYDKRVEEIIRVVSEGVSQSTERRAVPMSTY